MKQETFFSYARYRWMWFSILTVGILIAIYFRDKPVGGASGGTLVGYIYGGIATAGILFLMYYALRKRSYRAHRTTVLGTLSAHVWIGLALAIIVPLHSGFSFGWNVHTLAYALMLLVIISGFIGAIFYWALPQYFSSQRGGGSAKQFLEQIQGVDEELLQLTQSVSTESISTDATMIQDVSMYRFLKELEKTPEVSVLSSLFGSRITTLDRNLVASKLVDIPEKKRQRAMQIVALIDKKRRLLNQLQREIRIQTLLQIWLFFHVPLSYALVVCVGVHIFSVFYYW